MGKQHFQSLEDVQNNCVLRSTFLKIQFSWIQCCFPWSIESLWFSKNTQITFEKRHTINLTLTFIIISFQELMQFTLFPSSTTQQAKQPQILTLWSIKTGLFIWIWQKVREKTLKKQVGGLSIFISHVFFLGFEQAKHKENKED